jgi:hypothetical protein
LALLVFDCQAANRPHSPMINRWCCEATSNSGDIGSGCYLSMLAISLRSGITRNPKHLLAGTSLGLNEEKKIYKWRWERRLQSGQSKLTPSGLKIKTFSWGEIRLVRGRTSCAGEEKKLKEEELQEKILPRPKKEVRNKMMCHHLEEFRRRRVTTVMYQCKHGGSGAAMPPPPFAVPNVAFADPFAHLPQPQQSGHHWRIRCE